MCQVMYDHDKARFTSCLSLPYNYKEMELENKQTLQFWDIMYSEVLPSAVSDTCGTRGIASHCAIQYYMFLGHAVYIGTS
jgi:hypothetical protein